MTTTEVNLEMKDINMSYRSVQVLNSFNLEIKRGEFLSLLGPSGCGKSTSLNIMAGFLKPDSGDLLLDGKDIVNVPVHRRGLGMVFQRYTLFPHMNVFDNIAFGLKQRRTKSDEIKRRVKESLELVGLPHVAERFPAELSGGQQQRIALARALVVEPKILLLDEPLSSLDAKMRRYMQVELRRIHEELDLTTVYVTHDQEEAFVMSDRIALMNEGRIEQLDTPKVIYDSPRTSFVADFIGSSNILSGSIIGSRDNLVGIQVEEGMMIWANKEKQRFVPSINDKVDFMIREEHISITDEKADSPNALPGEVIRSVYQGAHVRYLCQLGESEVWVSRPSIEKSYETGDKVYITPEVENVRLLEPSPSNLNMAISQ